MKTVYEVILVKGAVLEPLLDGGVEVKEFETLAAAEAEARARVNDEGVDSAWVVEKRPVKQVSSPTKPKKEVQYKYQEGAPASDMALSVKEHFLDVSCPCGAKTPFNRQAVVDNKAEGMIAKCPKCQRHFKVVAEAGGFKLVNVELVPA